MNTEIAGVILAQGIFEVIVAFKSTHSPGTIQPFLGSLGVQSQFFSIT